MKRLIENNLKKEFVMLLTLIILIIEFVYMLYLKNDVSKTIDENEDNRVLAANSLNNEINRPDYNLFEFISKEQFFRWQVGKINESIIFCENSKYFFDSIEKNEHQILILVDSCYKIKCDEYSKNQEYVYLNIHVKLKNLDNSSGMINIKPMCQLILDDGSYDEFNTDKFTLVDMSFDTDVEGYTLANVPADNGKLIRIWALSEQMIGRNISFAYTSNLIARYHTPVCSERLKSMQMMRTSLLETMIHMPAGDGMAKKK